MNRLGTRVRRLENVQSGYEQKYVLWLVGTETKEEAMKKAGVEDGEDFNLMKVVFVSPGERVNDSAKKEA